MREHLIRILKEDKLFSPTQITYILQAVTLAELTYQVYGNEVPLTQPNTITNENN